MFAEIFKFELSYHRRQYLIYVLSGIFFILSFLVTTTPNVQLVGGVDNINVNAPYTVVITLASLSLLTLFGGIAFCANGVIRDYDLNTWELFLSTPVAKGDYIYGRFFGALVFAFCLYFAGMLGVLLGEFMPWLDAERIGETSVSAYWFATWAIAIPNIFVFSCIFFCVATVTRSMMATYVSMVVLLMLTFLLDTFTEKDTIELTSMLDPFGSTALEQITRYWTVFEKNKLVPSLDGALLWNRILWVSIGVASLAAAYPLTSLSARAGRKSRKKKTIDDDEALPATTDLTVAMRGVHQAFGAATQLRQFLSQTRLEVRNIVLSVPFAVLLLLGLFSVTGSAIGNLGNIFGTPVYPTTAVMVDIINGAFSLSLVSVLIYYAGELMVREKSVRINEILDAMPFPNWIMMAAKLTGLAVVIVAMLSAAALAGVGVQLYGGFYDIDIGHYLLGLLFFFQFPLYLMMVLAVFSYVVTRNKYAAMFIMVLYFLYTLAAPRMGFEHFLYRLRELQPVYSDFTGYSQNLVPYLWQTLYYGLFGCLLLVAIHLLWPRGIEDDWANRIKVVKQRMTAPVVVSVWAISTLWVLTGGYIYYNTVMVNSYVTARQLEAKQAGYEKKYKQYQHMVQPAVKQVYTEVDIFPDSRDVHLKGNYELANESSEAIEKLHISYFPYLEFNSLAVPNAKLEVHDEELGYRIYKFSTPMQPGERLRVDFDINWNTPGFANSGHTPKITANGTFFNNMDAFPIIGYRSDFELQDNNRRREHGLPPVERMAKIDDESAWMRVGLGSTHRVGFESIVSTSADQIALAPGYLQRKWVDGDRRYFHYKMDAPIWNFYSFLSGRYEVRKDKWNDVAIEVYYLHDYNVDTMIRSAKNSLDYFTANFSPYQYRQFRIVEFPRFQGRFAQSFPNTVPFSEAIGFVADLRDPEEIDYVYYVTAHELAHQWWAHQVLGADVQGSTMIVETLAQYSALMVMEKEYGPEQMKRFLEFELDRYLQGRGGELINELPLYLVENQPYIHYRKGSVVLYALKDYIGEDNMNAALARFIDRYAFKGPPYPTTRQLIAEIRQAAPQQYQDVITDLLEKIVLYDLRVEDSAVKTLADGRYEVSIDVSARKFEANGAGEESEVPISAWIDIGVLGDEVGEAKVPEVLFLKKFEVNQNEQTFTVVVDKKPVSVGIDPLNKLIDRDPSDNVSKVSS